MIAIAPGIRFDRYEILSQLGAGGMGEVYLAADTQLGRRVAIKFLPPELIADAPAKKRLLREAQTAAQLDHPNICSIYEVSEADGRSFIVMQYVEGETLGQLIRRQPFALPASLDIAVQVADALAEAHTHHILHRDIKPQNIMLTPRGQVKVLDFGLAKVVREPAIAVSEAETASRLTESGAIVGTMRYMSPEQVRAEPLDARSDLFSFGVVLYEMMSGHHPFAAATAAATSSAILTRAPLPLARYSSEVPIELERIVSKALHKDREERYQATRDLLLDLRSLKHHLEFEAELERSKEPASSSGASLAVSSGQTTVAAEESATRSGEMAAAQIRSSASGLITGIKQHKRGAAMLLATLLLAITGLAYFYFARGGQASINSVAVMPFVNVTNDPNTEYLSDGISENLINNLSQLPQLKVIARSSTFKYKGKEIDPEEVAKTLGVGAIVTGRVLQRGDHLQISTELVNALDKTQMWGEQYSRRAADLQAVQGEISLAISEKLRLRLTGAQEQQLAKRATVNPQAYQLYLTAMYYQRKGNVEDFKKALDYRKQAVALDPTFALAWAGIAVSYVNLSVSGLDAREAMAKAKEAAQTAVALDETLPEAHNSLALVKRFEWDWAGAESAHKRAIELSPNYAAAHNNYAAYLITMGRTAEALAEIKRAQGLDPFRISTKANEAAIFLFARRYDEALQVAQDVIKLQLDYGLIHEYLANTYAAKRMYTEAINEYEKYMSINGETTGILSYLGYAYAMSGKREEALAILDKLKTTKKYVSPADLGVLYAGLGDKEAAFQSLARAYAAHDMQLWSLKVNPHYDSLRADPRFAELMRRVGL